MVGFGDEGGEESEGVGSQKQESYENRKRGLKNWSLNKIFNLRVLFSFQFLPPRDDLVYTKRKRTEIP